MGVIRRQVWAVGRGLDQDTSGSEGVQDNPGGPRVSRNTVWDPDKPNIAVGLSLLIQSLRKSNFSAQRTPSILITGTTYRFHNFLIALSGAWLQQALPLVSLLKNLQEGLIGKRGRQNLNK